MNKLYNNINESFDSSIGSIGSTGYVTFSGSTPITIDSTLNSHYDLRAFDPAPFGTGATMSDLKLNNIGSFQGITVGSLNTTGVSGTGYIDNEQWKITTSGIGGQFLTTTPNTTYLISNVTNLICNSGFEIYGDNNWGSSASSETVSTDFAKSGTKSIKIVTTSGSSTDRFYYVGPDFNNLPVNSNTPYVWSAWVYSATGGYNLRAGAQEYNAGFGLIKDSYTTYAISPGWNQLSYSFTTQPLVVHALVYIKVDSAGPSRTFYVDDTMATQGTGLYDYIDSPEFSTPTSAPRQIYAAITADYFKDPQYRYSNSLYATFSGSTTISGTFTSSFNDNLVSGFSGDPNIDIFFRNFPARNAAYLISGSVSFSSDPSGLYRANQTDTFPLFQYLTYSGTGLGSPANAIFRVKRSQLTKSNPAALTNVKFNLIASGTGGIATFQPQYIRVKDPAITSASAHINTKSKSFSGVILTSGTVTNPVTNSYFFYPAKPKNTVQTVRFNTGTSPAVVSGTNQFQLFYRHNVDPTTFATSNITATLTSSGGLTNIYLDQVVSGTGYRLGSFSATLSGSTDYILRTTIDDNTARATVYSATGPYLQTQIATTGTRPLTLSAAPSRGYVGWKFTPYNYDFSLKEIAMKRVEFGTFTSKSFLGFNPVIGTKLNANTSQPITLLTSDDFIAYGDASLSASASRGNPPPAYVVTRSGINSWAGGIASSSSIFLGDTDELYLSGSIYPHAVAGSNTTYSGTYRVVLLNKYNQAGYVYNIPSLIGNQWNNFIIPIRPTIVAGKYTVIIQNVGFYPVTFEVDNIELNHNTISWSATNNGSFYQPFYDNINNEYSALHFATPGTNLQVKAAALSDITNWVESYTLYPIYND